MRTIFFHGARRTMDAALGFEPEIELVAGIIHKLRIVAFYAA